MKEKKQKLNVVTLVAIVVAAVALLGCVGIMVFGGGTDRTKSKVSEDELKDARAIANRREDEQDVESFNLGKEIEITTSGAKSSDAKKSGKSGSTASTSGDYVIPDSDSRKLTEADLDGLTKDEVRIARNEIMARHGRIFNDADLQRYFESKSWYDGTISAEKFDKTKHILSTIEDDNAKFIEKYEKKRGYR